ncbi:MAG: hypothetical protein V2A65_09250 [Candidatus Omnitrophota bacterium]
MDKFPRTMVGGVSLPRLICGSNWFLGFSHTSAAKDRFIKEYFDRRKIADILEAFLKYDVDAVMGPPNDLLAQAIQEAQERTGKKMVYICTPWKMEELDWVVKNGATFCFPHSSILDTMIDGVNKKIPGVEVWLKAIREKGMIPGLSTHRPDTIICVDADGLDVESYTQPYNAAGYLCQVETDWVAKIISQAKKPVMVIKPLAAGGLRPSIGLAFVWSTIRPIDMVTLGTMSPYEVEEDIEISLSSLEHRPAEVELQKTRSKKFLDS